MEDKHPETTCSLTCLRLVKKHGAFGKEFILDNSRSYTIGTLPDADVRFKDAKESHVCEIHINNNGEAFVVNMCTNNVFVNDEVITGKVILKHGDIIEMMEKKLLYDFSTSDPDNVIRAERKVVSERRKSAPAKIPSRSNSTSSQKFESTKAEDKHFIPNRGNLREVRIDDDVFEPTPSLRTPKHVLKANTIHVTPLTASMRNSSSGTTGTGGNSRANTPLKTRMSVALLADVEELEECSNDTNYKTPENGSPLLSKVVLKSRKSAVKVVDPEGTPKGLSPLSKFKSRRSLKKFDSCSSVCSVQGKTTTTITEEQDEEEDVKDIDEVEQTMRGVKRQLEKSLEEGDCLSPQTKKRFKYDMESSRQSLFQNSDSSEELFGLDDDSNQENLSNVQNMNDDSSLLDEDTDAENIKNNKKMGNINSKCATSPRKNKRGIPRRSLPHFTLSNEIETEAETSLFSNNELIVEDSELIVEDNDLIVEDESIVENNELIVEDNELIDENNELIDENDDLIVENDDLIVEDEDNDLIIENNESIVEDRTPNKQTTNISITSRNSGKKQLIKTQKTQNEPKNDLTNIFGIKQLMSTPKTQNEPKNDLTNILGVKQLMRTPKAAQKLPENDLTNIRGVKQLMRTPKGAEKLPENDLTDVRGVKQLLRTPKQVLRNESMNVSGLNDLFKSAEETPEKLSSVLPDLIPSNVSELKFFDDFTTNRITTKTYLSKTLSPLQQRVGIQKRNSVGGKSDNVINWLKETESVRSAPSKISTKASELFNVISSTPIKRISLVDENLVLNPKNLNASKQGNTSLTNNSGNLFNDCESQEDLSALVVESDEIIKSDESNSPSKTKTNVSTKSKKMVKTEDSIETEGSSDEKRKRGRPKKVVKVDNLEEVELEDQKPRISTEKETLDVGDVVKTNEVDLSVIKTRRGRKNNVLASPAVLKTPVLRMTRQRRATVDEELPIAKMSSDDEEIAKKSTRGKKVVEKKIVSTPVAKTRKAKTAVLVEEDNNDSSDGDDEEIAKKPKRAKRVVDKKMDTPVSKTRKGKSAVVIEENISFDEVAKKSTRAKKVAENTPVTKTRNATKTVFIEENSNDEEIEEIPKKSTRVKKLVEKKIVTTPVSKTRKAKTAVLVEEENNDSADAEDEKSTKTKKVLGTTPISKSRRGKTAVVEEEQSSVEESPIEKEPSSKRTTRAKKTVAAERKTATPSRARKGKVVTIVVPTEQDEEKTVSDEPVIKGRGRKKDQQQAQSKSRGVITRKATEEIDLDEMESSSVTEKTVTEKKSSKSGSFTTVEVQRVANRRKASPVREDTLKPKRGRKLLKSNESLDFVNESTDSFAVREELPILRKSRRTRK